MRVTACTCCVTCTPDHPECAITQIQTLQSRLDASVKAHNEIFDALGEHVEKLNEMQRWANEAYAERDALRAKLEDETTRRQNAEVARRQSESRLDHYNSVVRHVLYHFDQTLPDDAYHYLLALVGAYGEADGPEPGLKRLEGGSVTSAEDVDADRRGGPHSRDAPTMLAAQAGTRLLEGRLDLGSDRSEQNRDDAVRAALHSDSGVEKSARKSEPNEGLTPQQLARGERSGRSPE